MSRNFCNSSFIDSSGITKVMAHFEAEGFVKLALVFPSGFLFGTPELFCETLCAGTTGTLIIFFKSRK